jgi:hypothetical protein
MLSTTLAVTVAGLACCAAYAYAQRRRLPLPPGPPRWPLVGNLKFPTKDEYLVYADWHRAYGASWQVLLAAGCVLTIS